ncbi:MAG: transporter [Crocinitomicaceae bacterium]|nr:transporter [Crocinitomicaceae bacterium]
MRRGIIYILLLQVLPLVLVGQQEGEVLTEDQLIWFVEKYHPVARQGKLLNNRGESSVRSAKGGFDPVLHGNINQKYFDDKNYFSLMNGGLKIPTWYGVELKAGYDQNQGVYLNPENSVPSNGLWYGGVSVTLGQGLFIDQRRATLKKAEIYAASTQSEQRSLMNNLYFDAIKQYWAWVQSWNQYQVYEESVQLALTRFEGVKQSFFLGDRPSIDTLEAFIQVQNRQLSRNQAKLVYQNTTLKLSNYLWYENNTPLEITDSLRPPSTTEMQLPEAVSSSTLQDVLAKLPESHPEMQLYDYKLDAMDVDRRLKVEGLKPKVNLHYNALNEPVGDSFIGGYRPEDYKWGMEVSFPIFLRKQRGNLQLTKLEIQEVELNQQQSLLALQNNLKSFYNLQLNLQDQVEISSSAVANYNQLLAGERQKFDSGESSLFLVNSREINLIKAQIELVKLIAKYNVARIGLLWSAGNLYE